MSETKTVREHLKELKKRLTKIIITAVIIFFLSFMISENIIIFLINYFELELFVLSPLEFIRSQLMISLYITLMLLLPFTITQIYYFAKPAMKQKTKQKATTYFIQSLTLAIIGFIFGIFIFSKFSLDFFASLPGEVSALWGVYSAIVFIIISGFAFALTMQLILIIPILVKTGLVDINTFKKSRGIIIIIALAASAILTSPDPLTQILMSIPMYFCFEAGILISIIQKNKEFKKYKV